MKTLLKYLSALLLLLCAIGSMAYGTLGIIGAIFMLLAILICLPPTFDIIQKKIKVPILTPMKYIAVIVLSIIGFSLMASTEEFAEFQKENNERILSKQSQEAKKDSADAVLVEQKEETKQEEVENTIKESSANEEIEIGQDAVISSITLAAYSKDSFSELMTLYNANDELGIDNLINAGYVIQLPLGLRVKKIGNEWGSVRVRILSGKHKGDAVFVGAPYLKKI